MRWDLTPRHQKLPMTFVALAAALSVPILAMGTDCQGTPPGGTQPPTNVGGPNILSTDHVLGDANAPVTVVEYSDIQ